MGAGLLRRARWLAPAIGGCLAALAFAAPTAGAASFGSPVVVSQVDTAEPGIDVAPNGNIYVNAPSGLLSNLPGSPSYVWRSQDGGATWTLTPFGARTNLPGGGDSDIALPPGSGKLFMTDLWLGSSTVSTSTNQGQTWKANPLEGTPIQDRQWISATSNKVAYHLTHQLPAGLIVSRSIDGGLTYPIRTIAATPLDQTGCICPPGTMVSRPGSNALGLKDRVGFVYATSTGGVNFARSTDGALTFSQHEVSPASDAQTSGAFPVVSAAGGQRLVAVWQESLDQSTRVRYSTSADWGNTWSSPKTLLDSGTSLFPWVAASGSKIAVSLYHTSAAGTPATVPEGAEWFESYLESTDGGATFSGLQSADPTPVKTGPICTEGINCSGDRELLDFQSVALDGARRANLAYARSVDGNSDTQIRFVREG